MFLFLVSFLEVHNRFRCFCRVDLGGGFVYLNLDK
jgi:hypothetical protein